jgi:hypothetical protein
MTHCGEVTSCHQDAEKEESLSLAVKEFRRTFAAQALTNIGRYTGDLTK